MSWDPSLFHAFMMSTNFSLSGTDRSIHKTESQLFWTYVALAIEVSITGLCFHQVKCVATPFDSQPVHKGQGEEPRRVKLSKGALWSLFLFLFLDYPSDRVDGCVG